MTQVYPFRLKALIAFWLALLIVPWHLFQEYQVKVLGFPAPLYYGILSVWILFLAAGTLYKGDFKFETRLDILWLVILITVLPGILSGVSALWGCRSLTSFVIRGLLPGFLFYRLTKNFGQGFRVSGLLGLAVIVLGGVGLFEIFFGKSFLKDILALNVFAAKPGNVLEDPANLFYRPVILYKDPTNVFSLSGIPAGAVGNRIPYIASLTAFLPLFLWQARHGIHVKFFYSAVGGLLFLIVLSGCRSAWVAAGVACLAYLFISSPRHRRKLGIFCGATILAALFLTGIRGDFSERFKSQFVVDAGITHRLASYKTVFSIVKDYPWFGIGLGNYRDVYQRYHHHHEETLYLPTPDNQYLLWLAETGIVGFLGLAFFLGLTLSKAWMKIKEEALSKETDFTGAILAGFLGLGTHFLFFDGFNWSATQVTFWSFAGLLWASWRWQEEFLS